MRSSSFYILLPPGGRLLSSGDLSLRSIPPTALRLQAPLCSRADAQQSGSSLHLRGAGGERGLEAREAWEASPHQVEKVITMYLNRTNRSLLSITSAPKMPHRYFWRVSTAQVIDKTLLSSEIDAVTATAAARRAFGELPADARRSRRARFCEPAVPPLTKI